jgi:hypothetical protein
VAQLAAGGTLSFAPELEDDDLLPGGPLAAVAADEEPAAAAADAPAAEDANDGAETGAAEPAKASE